MPLFSRYFITLFIIILITVSAPLATILYIAKQAMAHVMSLNDKLESLTGNKNIRLVFLAQSLENKLNKSSTILQMTSRLPEIKSILQSQSNLTDNESVLLIDSFGHKAVAAYSNKESSPLFINTQEKPFSNLQSFKNALAGKFGSIVETINDGKVIVSYHLIKTHSNNWVLLLLQPYDKFVDELAQEHD